MVISFKSLINRFRRFDPIRAGFRDLSHTRLPDFYWINLEDVEVTVTANGRIWVVTVESLRSRQPWMRTIYVSKRRSHRQVIRMIRDAAEALGGDIHFWRGE